MKILLGLITLLIFHIQCLSQSNHSGIEKLENIDYGFIEIDRVLPVVNRLFLKEINDSTSALRKQFLTKRNDYVFGNKGGYDRFKFYPLKLTQADYFITPNKVVATLNYDKKKNVDVYSHLYSFMISVPVMDVYHNGVELNTINFLITVEDKESFNEDDVGNAKIVSVYEDKINKGWRKLKSYKRDFLLVNIQLLK